MIRILFIGALCVFSNLGYSQIAWGVKGGINFNKTIPKDLPEQMEDDSEMNLGYHLGVFGNLKLAEKLGLIGELQYTQRGVKTPDTKVRINYLEVPILLSYSPVKKLSIDAGPNVAFRLSTFVKSGDEKNKIDMYNAVDFGVNVGIQFNISDQIAIVGRYYHGLTAIDTFYFRDEYNNPAGEYEEFSRSAQLGLSYRFSSAK